MLPFVASGSSMINASVVAFLGTAVIVIVGIVSFPSQVYSCGIMLPSSNACMWMSIRVVYHGLCIAFCLFYMLSYLLLFSYEY